MKGPNGLECFRSRPGEDERVCGCRTTEWPYAELAVLQDFGVADRDSGAGGPVHVNPQATDEILCEVEDRVPRGGGQNLRNGEALDAAYGFGDARDRDGLG